MFVFFVQIIVRIVLNIQKIVFNAIQDIFFRLKIQQNSGIFQDVFQIQIVKLKIVKYAQTKQQKFVFDVKVGIWILNPVSSVEMVAIHANLMFRILMIIISLEQVLVLLSIIKTSLRI